MRLVLVRLSLAVGLSNLNEVEPFPDTFFWLTQSSVLGIFSGLVSIVCAVSDFCFTFRLFQLIKVRFDQSETT